MWDYFNLFEKRYEAVVYGAFFRFWKYWKLTLLWSKQTKTPFLSFGVSAITLLLIDVAYFWKKKFWQSHQAFLIFFLFLFSVCFCFLPKKGSSIFEMKKNRLTRYNHLVKFLKFNSGENLHKFDIGHIPYVDIIFTYIK